jgi:hypothetical protein
MPNVTERHDMDMKKRNQQNIWQIDLAGLIVCVGVSVAAYFLGLDPLLQQRSRITAQRGELVEEKRQCVTLEAALTTLKKKAIGIRQELTEEDVALESKDRINHRLGELATVLGCGEMQIDAVHTGQISKGRYCDLVPIRISGQSHYLESAAAFHELYRALRDVSIVGFKLEGAPDSSGQARSFSIDMFWYAAPDPRVLPGT